jgi:hypothetical protein
MATLIPPEELLSLYSTGWFPMAMADGSIRCFSPDPRGILPLEAFHIPHGARKAVRDPQWEVRQNTSFARVVRACARRRETWIDETIVQSYISLHQAGHAHSLAPFSASLCFIRWPVLRKWPWSDWSSGSKRQAFNFSILNGLLRTWFNLGRSQSQDENICIACNTRSGPNLRVSGNRHRGSFLEASVSFYSCCQPLLANSSEGSELSVPVYRLHRHLFRGADWIFAEAGACNTTPLLFQKGRSEQQIGSIDYENGRLQHQTLRCEIPRGSKLTLRIELWRTFPTPPSLT